MVALRKESVDRNIMSACSRVQPQIVALRKESVDRNMGERSQLYQTVVALRKESVDRNSIVFRKRTGKVVSLSARRAWIETGWKLMEYLTTSGRSPQGERG